MAMQHFNTTIVPTVPTVVSSETLGTDAFAGITEQGAVLLIRLAEAQQGTTVPTSGLQAYRDIVLMEQAEVHRLYAWLTEMDTLGKLRAEPVLYPALQQGSSFGTVRVVQDSCYPDVAEWYLGSDGTFSIDRYGVPGQYAELSQAETVQLLAWMNGLHARGLL